MTATDVTKQDDHLEADTDREAVVPVDATGFVDGLVDKFVRRRVAAVSLATALGEREHGATQYLHALTRRARQHGRRMAAERKMAFGAR